MKWNNGVAGWALSSHRSCLCGDITRFTPAEYALVDEARDYKLTSCFAICLRNTHTANDEYVLEFFLPASITDSRSQLNLVDSILATMKQNSKSLRDASGGELEERFTGEVIGTTRCPFDNNPTMESWLDRMCGVMPIGFRAHIKSNYSVGPPGEFGEWIFRGRKADEFTGNKWKVATEHAMKRSYRSSSGVLLQFWRATTFNGRQLLIASNQPFMLVQPNSYRSQFNKGLCEYRMICEDYQVYVDGESEEEHLGPLGRVFCRKLPEWTPHVRNYSTKGHPFLNDALRCNIALSLVLPMIEPSDESCVGVIELVKAEGYGSWRMKYVVRDICGALKDVNLTTSKGLYDEDLEVCRESPKHVVDEISKVLSVVCQTYKLPLAQTWIRCRHHCVIARDGGLHESCNMFDSRCIGNACMRLIDEAFYEDFRYALLGDIIMKGNNGVAGWALSSHRSCLCGDITRFTPAEYALVDEARECELTSCFAICLRSTHTADDEYILEFFLPPSITDSRLQVNLVDSILATLKQNSASLRDASGRVLEERFSGEVIEVKICSRPRSLPRSEALQPGAELVRLDSSDKDLMVEVIENTRSSQRNEAALRHGAELVSLDLSEKDLMVEVIETTRSPQRNEAALRPGAELVRLDSSDKDLMVEVIETTRSPQRPETALQPGAELVSLDSSDKDLMVEVNAVNSEMKVVTLAGISFSYQFLQQHFGKTLEDTAEDIGVSRSTLKRICRQHGISDWRHCKRKRKNHSLSKLENMNESVRGTEGEGSSVQPKIPVLQGVRSVTIKATYGADVIIKFELSSSSIMEDLQKEVTKRLKLEPQSFSIKYQDEDGDWILISCDEDLRYLMDTSTSSDRTTITMLVQLVSS